MSHFKVKDLGVWAEIRPTDSIYRENEFACAFYSSRMAIHDIVTGFGRTPDDAFDEAVETYQKKNRGYRQIDEAVARIKAKLDS